MNSDADVSDTIMALRQIIRGVIGDPRIPMAIQADIDQALHNIEDIPTSGLPPVPTILFCPRCKAQHVDEGEWATTHHHRTHLCAKCSHKWRPYEYPTIGITVSALLLAQGPLPGYG